MSEEPGDPALGAGENRATPDPAAVPRPPQPTADQNPSGPPVPPPFWTAAQHPPGPPYPVTYPAAAQYPPGPPYAVPYPAAAPNPTMSYGPYGPYPPRPRRPWLPWVIVAGSLVVVLVAGLVTWLAWPTSDSKRVPFDKAVANLAAASGVRYSSSFADTKFTVSALATGEVTGTASSDGEDIGVLEVGGKTYLKPPDGEIPDGNSDLAPSAMQGKWVTGDEGLLDPVLSRFSSPPTLARRLWNALQQQTVFPDAKSAITLDGVPALRADTTAGILYVSKDMPYRVLRYVPSGDSGTSHPQSPQPTASLVGPLRQQLPDNGGLDLESLSAPQVDQAYDDLQSETKELSQAVDAGIEFDLSGDADVNCSEGGCSVVQNFTGDLSSNSSSVQVTGGQVTATMTATVTINGEPAGECTSGEGTFPVSGASVSGQLSCDDPGAGPVFAGVDGEMRAQAEAESAAEDGAEVPYTIPYEADTEVIANALADAEVDRLVDAENQQRQSVDCSQPSNSFVAGTPVLLADGTTRPIEQVTPGTAVVTADPRTGRTDPEPVLAQITGGGEKQLDQLTVAHGAQTTSITATANHPFRDPDRHDWIMAGELRPGERLASRDGSDLRVVANRGYSQAVTVYNLAVADQHTYYVMAGGNAVLVHNAGPPCRVVNGWPKQEGGNCDACAQKIQQMIGGRIIQIKPKPPYPLLGPSTKNPDGNWAYHVAVEKDGRIYDGTTGPDGLPIDQFKAQWGADADQFIDFGL